MFIFPCSGILLGIIPLFGFLPFLFPFFTSLLILSWKSHKPTSAFFSSVSVSSVLLYFRNDFSFYIRIFSVHLSFPVLKNINYAYGFSMSFLIICHHSFSHIPCYFLFHFISYNFFKPVIHIFDFNFHCLFYILLFLVQILFLKYLYYYIYVFPNLSVHFFFSLLFLSFLCYIAISSSTF